MEIVVCAWLACVGGLGLFGFWRLRSEIQDQTADILAELQASNEQREQEAAELLAAIRGAGNRVEATQLKLVEFVDGPLSVRNPLMPSTTTKGGSTR